MDEQELRKEIEKRVAQRMEFTMHTVAYVLVNLMLWAIWVWTRSGFPWPIFVTIGWGIGWIAHIMELYYKNVVTERLYQRELSQRYGYIKPKRATHLTDDGELMLETDNDEINTYEDAIS